MNIWLIGFSQTIKPETKKTEICAVNNFFMLIVPKQENNNGNIIVSHVGRCLNLYQPLNKEVDYFIKQLLHTQLSNEDQE